MLLEGESGTGKDLLAHWLHYAGPRRDVPLIKVHCPSIPEELLESELFGHEAGAFTDAKQAKAGKIELAAGGTLYFDQVQDLTLALQAKLLRVVEEQPLRAPGRDAHDRGRRALRGRRRAWTSRQAVSAGHASARISIHRLSVVPLTLPAAARAAARTSCPWPRLFLARERERETTPARALRAARPRRPCKGYPWPGQRARAALGGRARGALLDGRGRGAPAPCPPHDPGAAGDALGGARPAARP